MDKYHNVSKDRLHQVPKRSTIIKPRVGCVKTTTYHLPEANHVYGYRRPNDPEGAGDLISRWVAATPSVIPVSKDLNAHFLVKQNILAVDHG